MRKTLLFTACIIILTMSLVFVSCKKKEEEAKVEEPAKAEEPMKAEEPATEGQAAVTEQEVVQEAEAVLAETEALEQALRQGKMSGTEAAQNYDTLKQKEAKLKKEAGELGTAAGDYLFKRLELELSKVGRYVAMEELPEEAEGKQK
jgi:hypothetical protein